MICDLFEINMCTRGSNCQFRHVTFDKHVVCKHWLRGLCKKGDDCEFLHEYDMAKMPECYFFSKFGRCENRDCQVLFLDFIFAKLSSVLAHRSELKSERMSVVRERLLQTRADVQIETCSKSYVSELDCWFLSARSQMQICPVRTFFNPPF
jgi:hypothetical protein